MRTNFTRIAMGLRKTSPTMGGWAPCPKRPVDGEHPFISPFDVKTISKTGLVDRNYRIHSCQYFPAYRDGGICCQEQVTPACGRLRHWPGIRQQQAAATLFLLLPGQSARR